MPLVLSITNVDKLENGHSTELLLDRHGAVIGRSMHVDWTLPDARNIISNTHCEVVYRDGAYWLLDKSTNGVLLNGAAERMGEAPHRLADGDVLAIGHYRIEARLDVAPRAAAPEAAADEGWRGWDPAPKPAAAPAAGLGFDPPSAPVPAPEPPPRNDWHEAVVQGSGWNAEPAGTWGSPAADDGWGAPASALSGHGPMADAWTPPPAASPAADVWAQLEDSNKVDWGRGGFDRRWGAPAPATAPPVSPQPAAQPAQPKASPGEAAWLAFLEASGLDPEEVGPPGKAGATAGALMRRLVAGLVVMLEARARAKAQLGARGTAFNPEGINPLKFSRTPDQALIQLLGPSQRGQMASDRAVDDAFRDLQAHQMATLAAMQGALRATLDRFAPRAIRERAEKGGFLANIIPGAREAALWRAYEREFDGVVEGSDEAFMDVFAKAFREAYDQAAGRGW
jgi:type VI secretion system FHA domain protein